MLTRSLTFALAVTAVIVAACHNDDSFSQALQNARSTPAPPSAAASTPETTTAPTAEVSLRPREIRFDKILSPCDLLLASQIDLLAGDQHQPIFHDEDREWRSPTCYYSSATRTWSITTVTDTGVEVLHDVHQLHHQLQVGYADPIAVAFPAYTVVDPARKALSCYLAIDTANQQMLVIGIELTPPANRRAPCTEARPIAEEAMRTLIT
jgi:hypothetical protein